MKQLNLSLETNVSYYIPCSLAQYTEQLKCYNKNIRLSLLLSHKLLGLVNYIKGSTKPRVNQWVGMMVGYENGLERLGIHVKKDSFGQVEDGITLSPKSS